MEQIPARDRPLIDHAAALESGKRLEQAMATLTPRLRQVVEGIRDGKSYSEIGNTLGISKQAAHKLAGAAITSSSKPARRLPPCAISAASMAPM